MSIKKLFSSTTAAAVLTSSIAATSIAPAPAEAQVRQVEPQSCRLLDRERQRIAREESRIAQQASRDIGRNVRDGIGRRGGSNRNVGDRLLGSILGGVAQVQVPKILGSDRRYVRELEGRCAADLERLEVGVCVTNQREAGTVATRNGRIEGEARGQIDQSRECTSTSTGNGRSILTPAPRP